MRKGRILSGTIFCALLVGLTAYGADDTNARAKELRKSDQRKSDGVQRATPTPSGLEHSRVDRGRKGVTDGRIDKSHGTMDSRETLDNSGRPLDKNIRPADPDRREKPENSETVNPER